MFKNTAWITRTYHPSTYLNTYVGSIYNFQKIYTYIINKNVISLIKLRFVYMVN